MVIVGIYITVASVAPVWILLQPRDYLSSFLLYFMMIVAAVGVIGSALMGHASLDIPAFTGFKDTLAPKFSWIYVPGPVRNHRLRSNFRIPFTRWFRNYIETA